MSGVSSASVDAIVARELSDFAHVGISDITVRWDPS